MRQNEISLTQIFMACLFITTIVIAGIFNKIGPFQKSLITAKYLEIKTNYKN